MTTVSSSTAGAPISFSGLSSGLNTSEIISALMGVERVPITRLTDEQSTLEGQRTQLQSFQSSLTQLTFDAQELGSPTLFYTSQAVSSSEPTRIAAAPPRRARRSAATRWASPSSRTRASARSLSKAQRPRKS